MNRCFLFLLLVTFLGNKTIFAQDDPNIQLTKVIPTSPNTASLGKFGDVPVGYFTGQVNTSIPLFDYGKGNLKGAVSLSYSPGGIKVEEVASWVGTGWALNAGGMIARTIRGIADEKTNGYFTADMKAKFMMDHYQDPTYHDDIVYRHSQASEGLYDLEPDIFIFNFDGYAGKFFYDQETEKFYTLTRSILKISYDAGDDAFTIQAPNGNKYYFIEKEITTNNTTSCYSNFSTTTTGNYESNTTTWLLTKIENSNQSEEINIEYNNYSTYSFNTIRSHVKYFPVAIAAGGYSPPMYDQNCSSNITIDSKKISAIYWNEGSLQFKVTNTRSDLPGEKSLDTIKLYSSTGQNIKNYVFKYNYFSGDSLSSKLRLDSLYELSANNTTGSPYTFSYESGSFPSRLSYAQDYWGYYNGESGNSSLIPTWYFINTGTGQPMPFTGAQRQPVFSYAKTGTLNKITYPTGGYTEFTYENNKANNSLLPPEYTVGGAFLEGDHNGGQQTYYETDEFTIDVPPSFYNGFHSGGGVYANFSFGEIGCEYINYVPNACAVLAVEGVSSGAPGATITNPNVAIYFPNGTYKLTASFNQGNHPGFEDFYFQMNWKVPDLSNLLAGGLRVQKITDYDGINHANDKIRRFEYLNEDSTCSGYFISDWDGIFHSPFYTYYAIYPVNEINEYHKFQSQSNYPLVTDKGSYVVYLRVTEYQGENGENGKAVYTFNAQNDFVSQFPYYQVNREWTRGELLTQTQYENKNSTFLPISDVSNTYQSSNDNDTATSIIAVGIKQGKNKQYVGGIGITGEQQEEWIVPSFDYYGTISGWTKQLSSVTKSNITQQDTGLITNDTLAYNENIYVQNRSATTNSKGDSIINKISYVADYTGTLPTWLQNLKDNNMLDLPIERISIKKLPNGSYYVISSVVTTYMDTQPLPSKVYSLDINEPLALGSFTATFISGGVLVMDSHYKERIGLNKYDNTYNILEQQKKDDVKQAYIWDYNNYYPVAEVVNAAFNDIAYSSFETDSTGNWSFNTAGNTDSYYLTGKKSYTITSHTISKTGLTSGNYIVSYWSRNGSMTVNSGSGTAGPSVDGWTYYEHSLSSITSITMTGSGTIDELRLYPSAARMTTYTYTPLVGATSQCDMNNRIVFYEYDNMNRLSIISDQDKKVVKKIEYKYQVNYDQQ